MRILVAAAGPRQEGDRGILNPRRQVLRWHPQRFVIAPVLPPTLLIGFRLLLGRKDNTIYFDDLGVDPMFVDEAHFFKALPFATKMGNISGLSTRQSQRAQNMLAKIEYLYDTHNNRGVVFATGTAITNTLGESYTMSRYLAPDILERAGIKHFDDWAANFAETTTKLEYAVDGSTIRPKTSLSTFVNVPELRQLWAQFADVVTQDAAVAGGYIKVPYAVRKDELVEVTPEQEPMLQEIAERGECLMLPRGHPEHPEPTVDNWLKLDSDARDISLDARMRDSSAADHPGNKVNAVVRLAREVHARTHAESGTTLVFADRYATSEGKFNIFSDIKGKLIAGGVKLENEIRQISLLDRASQLSRYRNKQELDGKHMDLEYMRGQLPVVERAIESVREHEVRDGEGKLVRLKLVWNDKQFSTIKEASEYLKAHPKVDDDTLLEVNGIGVEIVTRRATRTDLASGRMVTSTLVEYRLAGEWFDAPKGEIGSTTSAQSLVTSVLMRTRDLEQRAERLRNGIVESGVSIERLGAELEKPSAYDETLKMLNRRLEEVSAELLGSVKAEDEIADSSDLEQVDSEVLEPKKGTSACGSPSPEVKTSSSDETAVAAFKRHARELVERYGYGIDAVQADLLIASKMAGAGWKPNEVSDGVRSAGFRANDLRGAELVAYAGKVSEKALSAAGQAVNRSVDRGVER